MWSMGCWSMGWREYGIRENVGISVAASSIPGRRSLHGNISGERLEYMELGNTRQGVTESCLDEHCPYHTESG